LTVNGTVLLVPLPVATDTLYGPATAPAAIVKVAVICTLLTNTTLLTVTPVPETATVAPELKFVPAKVTFTAVPGFPLFGDIEVSVGARLLTVNGTVPLVPLLVVTETL
jgi:hypothetical protein